MGTNHNEAAEIGRPEYPRPQFVRDHWVNLNGEWEFAFDDEDRGSAAGWSGGEQSLGQKIQVPFAYQSRLSGIGETDFHDNVWYRRLFDVPESFAERQVLLYFGAVDYAAKVWVNGVFVAAHEGGHTPFKADITHALHADGTPNALVVQALDESRNLELPRGKQFWKKDSASIFYTRTTGIWQTVWIEAVPRTYLDKVKLTPDIDNKRVEIVPHIANYAPGRELRLRVSITFGGVRVTEQTYDVTGRTMTHTIGLANFNAQERETLWAPEHPNLYDISYTLLDGEAETDRVESYFGMRKISVEGGRLCLNNSPYKMKLVLDQGYFPDGILTPPSEADIRRDIELTKEMGFNGARKHQKLEDPRYLYGCDKLGLLVWSEAANAYSYSDQYVERFQREWIEAVDRDYNHPSIVVWVPLNESWGVPDLARDPLQQHHSLSLVYLTKSLDRMRPVISNDGWEHTVSDLVTIHDYEWRREVLEERYAAAEKALSLVPGGHPVMAHGYDYRGEPLLVTEFGGIGYRKSEWEGWGYSGASSDEDFEERLRNVIGPLLDSELVQGYCYTQLTDVEQEINGLLTYDRVPKIPLDKIRAINEGR
ncbi:MULTISPECIES: glycoside hydrolase family 2 protein [Saccharibacillus]|uniref:glycoside hydrolase family 2 protein n=1 Tax=Saccharibacillus TaxID=456492 RepID=UPI001238B6F7|nr:sugar-binding domain-containing protein [Saccharibacillus sp. WB 17]MWJ31209.1 glycoside hydrolase family 2 [Saccharibacillus sp. WB 17]